MNQKDNMKRLELKTMIREELLREVQNTHLKITDLPQTSQKLITIVCKILKVDTAKLDIFGNLDSSVQVDIEIPFSGWSYLSAEQLATLSKTGIDKFMFDRKYIAFILNLK